MVWASVERKGLTWKIVREQRIRSRVPDPPASFEMGFFGFSWHASQVRSGDARVSCSSRSGLSRQKKRQRRGENLKIKIKNKDLKIKI